MNENPQTKYVIVWEDARSCTAGRSEVVTDYDKAERICKELDGRWPSVKHRPDPATEQEIANNEKEYASSISQ